MTGDEIIPLLSTQGTALLVGINSLCIALAIFASARNQPRAITRSLHIFGMGRLLLAISFMLVAERGIVSAWLSVALSNTLSITGVYLSYSAIRSLQSKSERLYGLFASVAVVAIASVYFVGIDQDLRGVRIVTSIVAAIIMFLMADELLRKFPHDGTAHIIGGWLAAFNLLACLVRVFVALHHDPIPVDTYPDTVLERSFMVLIFASSTINAVNFVLISNEFFNAELRRLATLDTLTNLFNRRHMVERGAEEIRRAIRFNFPLAILAIDLDHFKKVNDTYGHGTGDKVLKVTAQTCAAMIRDVDLVGRVGGEEFLVLLSRADMDSAQLTAERIRAAVEGLCLIAADGTPVKITTSIGVAVRENDETFEQLWETADQALYRAKALGRNRVVLSAELKAVPDVMPV